MIHIEHLRLQLPAEFADRAATLGQALADELKHWPGGTGNGGGSWPAQSVNMAHLSLPTFTLDPALSDRVLARQMAESIRERIVVNGQMPPGQQGHTPRVTS